MRKTIAFIGDESDEYVEEVARILRLEDPFDEVDRLAELNVPLIALSENPHARFSVERGYSIKGEPMAAIVAESNE